MRSRLSLFIAALCCISVSFAGDYSYQNAKATKSFHHELDASGLKSLNVETTNGGITLKGSNGDAIIADAEIRVRGEEEQECYELLEKVEIRIERNGKALEISVKHPKKSHYTVSVDFNIQLPRHLNVEASTVNGGVNSSDVSGKLELSTVNGGINCSDVEGDIESSTVNGGINLVNISGNVEASTVNGGITCNMIKTPPTDIELSTINGSIHLELQGSPNTTLEAQTLHGTVKVSGTDVEASAKNPRQLNCVLGDGKGNYELSSINGSIQITVTGAQKKL